MAKNVIMTPTQVWQGYKPRLEELDSILNESYPFDDADGREECWQFSALHTLDGRVRVGTKVHYGLKPTKKYVLLVQSYKKEVDPKLIYDLVKRGYVVVLPDYSALSGMHFTLFPPSLNYGVYENAGEHLTSLCPTPRETCQYLYSKIIKRTITFIESTLGGTDIVLMGIDEGTDIAMQAAAMDERLKGVILVNGIGYREYASYNKYEDDNELVIDENMIGWMTGVASVAYAKHISAPILFVVPGNSELADIDRLSNVVHLMKDNLANIVISAGYRKNVSGRAYNAMLVWLRDRFKGQECFPLPELSMEIKSNGSLYAIATNVNNSKPIRNATVYYSYGETDHRLRFWHTANAEMVASNENLARIEINNSEVPLFAYIELEYRDGQMNCSCVDYMDLKGASVKATEDGKPRIIYQSKMGIAPFAEETDEPINIIDTLRIVETPFEVDGLTAASGKLLTYAIGSKQNDDGNMLLQIDVYSEISTTVTVELICAKARSSESYVATKNVVGKDYAFSSLRFTPNDFKNITFKPLENWSRVKGIIIDNVNIALGKIIYL